MTLTSKLTWRVAGFVENFLDGSGPLLNFERHGVLVVVTRKAGVPGRQLDFRRLLESI